MKVLNKFFIFIIIDHWGFVWCSLYKQWLHFTLKGVGGTFSSGGAVNYTCADSSAGIIHNLPIIVVLDCDLNNVNQ